MLNNAIGRIVAFCTRFAWGVIALSVVASALSGSYAARHFAINTDIAKLISPELPWRQREIAFERVFPQTYERILAVVQAPTPELAARATQDLAARLAADKALFRSVQEAGGGEFFRKQGLLFLPKDELAPTLQKLTQATPLIGTLASDPNLRGLGQALSVSFIGIQRNQLTLNDMSRTLNAASDTIEGVLTGRPANFSWQSLMKGKPPESGDLRRFIDIWPILDFSALEPGQKPIAAVREAARDLQLESKYGASVRLTGPVPISDEEFGTLKENALLNTSVTIGLVLLILWLALKSARIILAVFLTLAAGLAVTAALGLFLVKALNPISVAFAVLFVGLGVDFGIQYSVRYRSERFKLNDLNEALISAGRKAGAPLTLAAVATAAGFWSFLPTSYSGLSELGLIAGSGMLIAFLTSVTLLPALLKLLHPAGESEPLGYAAMAPLDRFFERHRIAVVALTGLVVIGGLPLLYFLRFDFNPLNLRNPHAESIATYLELRRDPATNAHTVQVLAPNIEQARATAKKLAELPEVSRAVTVDSFVPDDQAEKLRLIGDANKVLTPALRAPLKPAPSDSDRVNVLNATAANLLRVAGSDPGPGAAAAKRLAEGLTRLANADEATRLRAEAAFITPLQVDLEQLRDFMQARQVTLETLPPEITTIWLAKDGRARVDVSPKGDPNDNDNIRAFARAVLAAEPSATGEAIGILESGDTVVTAFIQAGFWALLSISVLLWIVLRRFGDVLLTIVPLLLAGALTLEICVLIGLKLNFANIIALPLLLGVGVAFKIYYVMAWRAGQTNLLQTSLTRAVVFSSLTTATAFGSLWFSSHPGTSSMGKLLALALVCTMSAAVLFQPALMGPPRDPKPATARPPAKTPGKREQPRAAKAKAK
jgi:hopanoid biosynthesis associated RND transporter like protein HpnN